MAGGIAQGRQNPGLVSKAGGWVPSDSHLLSEPQVPAALSSRGHLPGLGLWLRSSVLLQLAGLGLRRRVPVGKISGAHPPTPASRDSTRHCPFLGRSAETLRISIPSFPGSRQRPSGCQDRWLPGSHPPSGALS